MANIGSNIDYFAKSAFGQLQTVRYDLQFSVSGRSDEHQWLGERVSDIDIERCPHCGGQLKLIAAIEEPAVIQRIRIHLGLAARTGRGR